MRQGSAYRKAGGDNLRQVSQDQIAKELGITSKQLRDIKRLTTLLPDIQDIISEGRITPTTGYKVIAKLSEEEQRKLFEELSSAQKFTQKQSNANSPSKYVFKCTNQRLILKG